MRRDHRLRDPVADRLAWHMVEGGQWDQPYIILREATFEELVESSSQMRRRELTTAEIDQLKRLSYYYEIATD